MSDSQSNDSSSSEPVDRKATLEKQCHPPCEKQWQNYQACTDRIKGDDTGVKHCTGWSRY
jgi:ubiquinol-cytochrome c reductase subunit 6